MNAAFDLRMFHYLNSGRAGQPVRPNMTTDDWHKAELSKKKHNKKVQRTLDEINYLLKRRCNSSRRTINTIHCGEQAAKKHIISEWLKEMD